MRTFRCRGCGKDFQGHYNDVVGAAQQGAQKSGSPFGKGILGSLAGAIVGAAGGAVGAMAVNSMQSRCPFCGASDAELIPEFYTVPDYKAVERLVSAAWRKRTTHGERAFEAAWATQYEIANIPSEQRRMPYVEPKGESLATHRMAANELYGALTEGRRSRIEAAPDVDWMAVIHLRAIYESMRPDLRWSILEQCREVVRGERAITAASLVRDERVDLRTVGMLVEEFEAIDRESEASVVEDRVRDKFEMKAREIEILKGPLEHEAYWLLHYRLGALEAEWREARMSGVSTTTMATHRAAADLIYTRLLAETRARLAGPSDVDWVVVLGLREIYRKAKKRQRVVVRAWVDSFVLGTP